MKQIIIALILLSTASAKAALVSHWAFDETTGSIASNSVSGGTDGTILGGVTTNLLGKIGRAYQFDGTNTSLVEMDNYKGILGATNRTVNIWLKTTAGANISSETDLIAWGESHYDGGRWWEVIEASGKVKVSNYNANMSSSSTVTNNIWRMFTVVLTNGIDSTKIKHANIYIDGTHDAGNTGTKGIDTDVLDDVRVGKGYTGLLDDPAIWDEALSTNEVACLYGAAQEGYNAYYFDQLKQLHDAGTGSIKLLDDWWEYASGLTGSPGLNANSVRTWLLFDEAAGTGVSIRVSGSVFRFK